MTLPGVLAVVATVYLIGAVLAALWTVHDNRMAFEASRGKGPSPVMVGLRWPLSAAYLAYLVGRMVIAR